MLILLFSLLPVFKINKALMKIILPRESIIRLLFYMVAAFGFVFAYTFGIVWVISHLFPPAMK
jgi:hypothetical protein